MSEQSSDGKCLEVTRDMFIRDALALDYKGVAGVLMSAGMHCVGCPSAQMETIEEAAAVHGEDADLLVDRINEFLREKEEISGGI